MIEVLPVQRVLYRRSSSSQLEGSVEDESRRVLLRVVEHARKDGLERSEKD